MTKLTLPYPPSINRYWRMWRNRMVIGKEGREFRSNAIKAIHSRRHETFGDERISIRIYLYPPDKRRRDIDNPMKALIDALQHAKVFNDDSQVDELCILRRSVDRVNPRAEVEIAICKGHR